METLEMNTKLNLAKEDKHYYGASAQPQVKDLDSYYYLTIGGQSSPEDEKFLKSIEVIYAAAYGIKFLCKGEDNDFVVPKMECQWFLDGGPEIQHLFTSTPQEQWCWNIMMRMPDFVEADHFFRALENIKAKKPELLQTLQNLKFELVNEGKCVQAMHIGSWDEEGPTIEKIFDIIKAEGLTINGYHKEIYISEPTRVAEEKRKTIIRYPVK